MNEWNLELARMAKQALFDALGFVLLFGAFWGLSFKYEVWPKIAAAVVLLTLLLFCGNGFALWLASPLTTRSEKWAAQSYENRCAQTIPTLVVLGGGNLTNEVLSHGAQLRIVEAAKVLKQRAQDGKKNWVVLAGGVTSKDQASEAKVMRRQLFMETGEAAGKHDFILEDRSLNTYQNAVFVADLVKAKKLKKEVILVTGAVHMPRAKASFEKAGFTVCVLSAGFADFMGNGLAGFSNGAHTVSVLNEYFGFLGYRVKGWL
jgi:uncharacterized SAM-binding protein YcdF (DUF218 family)